MAVCSVTYCRLPQFLAIVWHGLFVAVDVLILMIQYCFYTLLLAFRLLLMLLSQLFTAFGNCLFSAVRKKAPNLPVFNFCFLSCLPWLSSVPEEFVLLLWTKGIHHHLPLLNKWEVLHWSLMSLHSSSVLSLPWQQTRNNIVKRYLHEKANAFFICFRGVQGAGRRLFCSSLTHFSSLNKKCLGTL